MPRRTTLHTLPEPQRSNVRRLASEPPRFADTITQHVSEGDATQWYEDGEIVTWHAELAVDVREKDGSCLVNLNRRAHHMVSGQEPRPTYADGHHLTLEVYVDELDVIVAALTGVITEARATGVLGPAPSPESEESA